MFYRPNGRLVSDIGWTGSRVHCAVVSTGWTWEGVLGMTQRQVFDISFLVALFALKFSR